MTFTLEYDDHNRKYRLQHDPRKRNADHHKEHSKLDCYGFGLAHLAIYADCGRVGKSAQKRPPQCFGRGLIF